MPAPMAETPRIQDGFDSTPPPEPPRNVSPASQPPWPKHQESRMASTRPPHRSPCATYLRPAAHRITSITSIISITSIGPRGRKKGQSTKTPTRENHRRIPCPLLPRIWSDFAPPLKSRKNDEKNERTHFNHFNHLPFSQNGQSNKMPTMGNHRRIAGVVGCEFSRIGPSPQNRKAKILKWGRIGKTRIGTFKNTAKP